MDPRISIVITTKNEAHNIGRCLASIKEQSCLANLIEVLVIDNSSTDDTVKIAKEYGVQVFNQGPERSAQRNYGMRKAKGKYLMYLDADMVLGANLLKRVDEVMTKGNVVGLYIDEKVMGEGYWAKVRAFERSFYTGSVIDCVRVVSKEAFEKSKGFDESLTGPEDWDFDKRIRSLGATKVLDGACIYHYEGNIDVHRYIKKKGYYIKSFNKYKKKWPNDSDLKKQFGLGYRYLGVFVETADKRKRFMSHIPLLAGMYWLRFLVGWEYLKSRL